MKVKELKKILDKLDDEDEIYVDKSSVEYIGEWESAVEAALFAKTGSVHPIYLKIARRPCKETEGSKKALIIYVKQKD
jgi:hypothetical protein